MKLDEKEYKEWKIYSAPFLIDSSIGEKIIDKDFEVISTLKDTKRNYVAIIEIENKKFILKEFRSEVIIPQRKMMTFFKNGEALTTLKNGIESIEEGVYELVRPLVALVKRKKLIEQSYILMEYIEGNKIKTEKEIEKIVDIIKKVHSLRRYHGDLNTSNFIEKAGEIKMIDTQMKKENFGYLNRVRDFLVLKEDLLVLELGVDLEKIYPEILKVRGYYLSKILRKLKKLKVIEYIRAKKKSLRKKGWKI